MSGGWILIGIGVLVLASIVYELSRDEAPPNLGTDTDRARQLGHKQAAQGFGKDDYPTDYSDAERDAWRRGWDEYQESKK